MKAPDKIYIDKKDAEIPSDYYAFSMPPYVNHKYIEYIHKETILEWARNLKERWEEPPMSNYSPGCVYMLEQLIDKINSL